jgi:lysozyme family protein
MKVNFTNALELTLKYEGGWVDHPEDPGGPTMRGVTQRVYDRWRTKKGLATRSVRSIDENELQAIYKIQYWDLIHGDKLPSGIDAAVFDFAVNSGATRATQELQRVLKLRTDGNMGAVTIEACNQADTENLIVSYCDARLAFVKKLSTFGTFGRGWKRRITAVREACLDMVSGDTRRVSFMSGDEDDAAMAAHADVRDIAPSSTLVVKGSAATGLGIAGASLTETAEKLSWVSEYSGVLMGLFVALMVAGIGLTVYAQIRSIKNETPE